MQKPCQNYIHEQYQRIRLVESVLLNPDNFDLPCINCGKKEFEHTYDRLLATRSLSFTLRSLVKLMKVSISYKVWFVKFLKGISYD